MNKILISLLFLTFASIEAKEYFHRVYILQQNILGANWLYERGNGTVYGDWGSGGCFSYVGYVREISLASSAVTSNLSLILGYSKIDNITILKESYVYLEYIQNNEFLTREKIEDPHWGRRGTDMTWFLLKAEAINRIYSNGGCTVLKGLS